MQTRSPLEDELRARISGEVRFDDGSRALYSTDGSVYRQVPIVVLEPSCASVFRDELPRLFPHDTDALRLAQQTYLLSQFLTKQGYQPADALRANGTDRRRP